MDKHGPWRPRMKKLPVFNPFEPSTKWYADMGADDQIAVEDDEEVPESSEPADAAATNSDEK